MEGGYEGQRYSREKNFGFWGGGSIILILRDCIFLVLRWGGGGGGGMLQGCISCWEFWARGPGILTESWS
jgi:hypothetical protein